MKDEGKAKYNMPMKGDAGGKGQIKRKERGVGEG